MEPENSNQNTGASSFSPEPVPPAEPQQPVAPVQPNQTPGTPSEMPAPGQVITGGFNTPNSSTLAPNTSLPSLNENRPGTAAQLPGLASVPGQPPAASGISAQSTPPKRRSLKIPLIALIVILLLAGSAAAYFGYYMNPSVILSQSLSKTGKGYDKLIDYADQQTKGVYKGSNIDGTYKFKNSETSTDGKISIKTSGSNSDTTADIGLAATRVKIELRSIKTANADKPDLYLKASGIKGLGTTVGISDMDTIFDKLDNQWIAADHTLIDNLTHNANAKPALSLPARSQIIDELRTFGKVNQQYVFTADKNKSVTKVVKKYGFQTVDGHKTYHYKMALDKANLKDYLSAQQKALNSSQLGSWIKKNKYQDDVNKYFQDTKKSVNSISSKDDFDLWVDVNRRLVYKVRIPDSKNPATNYADIGLNYKGGSSYPFFISGHSKEGDELDSATLVATIDSKANTLNLNLALKSTGTDAYNLSADLTYAPTNKADKIKAPSKSEPLSQVLEESGLDDWLDQIKTGNSSSSANNSTGASDKKPAAKTNLD